MRVTSHQLEEQLEKVRELEGLLTFRFSVLSKLLDQQVVDLLKDTPLGLTSYRVVRIVETFGQISLSEISRYAAMDRAQISRTAADLEKRGLVAFRSDPTSRRKKLVTLTQTGQNLVDEINPRFVKRRKDLKAGLGKDAEAALWKGMNKPSELLSA